MTALSAFGAGLREVFTLRAAEARSHAYERAQLEEIRRLKSEARSCLRASRRIANPGAALLVLRDAHAHAGRAAARAGEAADPMPELDADVDALPFAEAETLRDRADAAVRALLDGVESRTPIELMGLRVGRPLAVVVLMLGVLYHFARDRWLVHDVALHKPVLTSPLRSPPATGVGVTDGHTRGTFAVQTMEAHPAFVTVDLEREYGIRTVKVYNRGDGWFFDSFPLSLDLSNDGVTFHAVARKNESFEVWTVDLGGQRARFVRVSKDGYVALNEIEVYARD